MTNWMKWTQLAILQSINSAILATSYMLAWQRGFAGWFYGQPEKNPAPVLPEKVKREIRKIFSN